MADRRRTDRRRQAERLVQRARWLRSDERAVVEAVYGEGRTCADLARLMDQPADAVRRRVRRATRRAASGLFVFVATRREKWPATRRRVATRCVLEGATLREAAAELKLSLHAVRKHWDAVRALYEAEGAAK
ncbi:MAG: sigma factor-like helix-turn-helix DNA-binding protein [Planctomycetota bacterium]